MYINLINNNLLFYQLIYSLKLVKLEILKTYTKIYLTNNFIIIFILVVIILILFICKKKKTKIFIFILIIKILII